MSQEIAITLTLNDLASPKLEKAEGHVKKIGDALDKIGKAATGVTDVLGLSFDVDKIADFVHEGIEMAHQLGQANAQVRASLISGNNAAGISYEELEKSAKKFSESLPVTQAEVVEMQSQLLVYPGLTKNLFDAASQAAIDMSARTHKALDTSAAAVAKALQNPAKGLSTLVTAGAFFNESQTATIKKLAETNHTAEAQALILKQLQTEFGGAARAAAAADPLFRYNKLMEGLKVQTGELGETLLENLAPALEDVAHLLSGAFEIVHNNKTIVSGLAGAVVGGAIAYGGYMAVLKGVAAWQFISNAYTTAANALSAIQIGLNTAKEEGMVGLTAAQWALNAAMDANPVGAILAAVGVLVGLLSVAFGFWNGMFGKKKKVEIAHTVNYQAGQNDLNGFSGNLNDAATGSAKFADGMASGSQELQEQEKKANTNINGTTADVGSWADKQAGMQKGKLDQAMDVLAKIGQSDQEKKKFEDAVYAREMDFLNKNGGKISEDQIRQIRADMMSKKDDVIPKKAGIIPAGNQPKTGKKGSILTTETSKATGSSSVNIHITIGSLGKDMKIINYNGLKEAGDQIHDFLVSQLTAAVRDSQMVAH